MKFAHEFNFSAAFKIIKSWLPARAVEKIKFVNKTSLKDFVSPDQALVCWGGRDDYIYTFKLEANGRFEDGRKKVCILILYCCGIPKNKV